MQDGYIRLTGQERFYITTRLGCGDSPRRMMVKKRLRISGGFL